MTDIESEKVVQSLVNIASEIGKIEHARKVRLKATHGRFNLFTTILEAHDEVRLHTRFLHMLLNPTEHHDCERLFLNLFLEILLDPKVVDHEGNAVDLAKLIETLKQDKFIYGNNEESRSPYGQFDLFLEFEGHIILIENKVRAGEGDQQLERYASFLEKEVKKTSVLLYLTLDGKASDTAAGNTYYRISYETHILKWLKKCLQATYSYVNINQALQQYESVINQLLGNTLEASDMDKIKKLLKAEEGIMMHADQIAKALHAIRSERDEEFKKECCEAVGLEETNGAIKQWDCGVAVKLSNPKWGPVARTELCGVMYDDDTYGVMVYDIPLGELKKVIDTAFGDDGWSSGSKAYTGRILRRFDKKEGVMALLKEIAGKLK